MKKITTIKAKITTLPLIGLVLLLLLTSCKIRNFVEAEFGLTKTTVINKNKATLPSSSCQVTDASEAFSSNERHQFIHFDFFAKDNFSTKSFNRSGLGGNSILPERRQSLFSVPLYILFQNFKIHL
ncbi:MAG: hypothetical protein EA341_12495 [Mongoliibacter sp.]|nr:MAG: hypothetical protein EA341_12495 [Mongoliibacter sp.]